MILTPAEYEDLRLLARALRRHSGDVGRGPFSGEVSRLATKLNMTLDRVAKRESAEEKAVVFDDLPLLCAE